MDDRNKAHALLRDLEDLAVHYESLFEDDRDEEGKPGKFAEPLFDVRLHASAKKFMGRFERRWRLRIVSTKFDYSHATSYEIRDVAAVAEKYGVKVTVANNGLELV